MKTIDSTLFRICIIEFQVVEVLQMIFESPGGFPSLEELVLSDLFRNIDLREMRGSCVPVSYFKQLHKSTKSR